MRYDIKKIIPILVIAVMMASMLFGLTSCLESDIPQYDGSYLSGEDQASQGNAITVIGEGKVKVIADLVRVKISVVTEKPTSEEAVQENTEITSQVIKAVERIDAEYLRVQTTGYDLSPLYNYKEGEEPPEIYAYRVSSSVDVETTDLEKTGEIIAEAIDSGANDISSLQFDLSAGTREKAKKDSLKEASLDAASKADAIADSLGLELGNILFINESGTSFPQPIYSMQKIESVMTEERDLSPPPVEPQEIEVQASVTVGYSFR